MPGLIAPATDPGLPALEVALDTERMAEPLARAAGVAPAPALPCSAAVMAYKPGQRCTIHYVLGDGDERVELVGKVYRRPVVAERVAGWMRAVSEPPPHAVVSELGLLIRPHVPGRDLRHALDDRRAIELCARRLAQLHGAPAPPGVKPKPLAHEMRKLDAWCEEVDAVIPSFRLRDVRRRLHALAGSLPEQTPALIHRDFYYANVLWDGARVWLLDLDELGVGDAAFDVGHFLAHLDVLGYRTAGGFHVHAAAAERFTRAYAPRAADADRIRLYRAYTFLKLAATEVRRRRAGWLELAEALVARSSLESQGAGPRAPDPRAY